MRRSGPLLGLDVDSTVWDLTAWVCEATFDVTGEQLNSEKITTWTHILDFYGEEAATQIYERALSPHRVRECESHPGSSEVLRRLQERGISIPFQRYKNARLGVLRYIG